MASSAALSMFYRKSVLFRNISVVSPRTVSSPEENVKPTLKASILNKPCTFRIEIQVKKRKNQTRLDHGWQYIE